VGNLYRTGHLKTYQSYQAKPIFECEYIVVFLGLEGTLARFVGVYKVLDRKTARDVPVPPDFPYPNFATGEDIYYELTAMPGYEDFEDRIIIDWGKGTRSWHQRLSEKEVFEVLPKGYVTHFPGYFNFVLSFEELSNIIKNPFPNREWHQLLSQVAGIYLIVDSQSGLQYVGSAYGQDGILGRWKDYVNTKHGGNQKLVEILSKDMNAANNFNFSILHTLPLTLTQGEVIDYEILYKKKLGSRAFGLNSN
jgi:hypothetical protein